MQFKGNKAKFCIWLVIRIYILVMNPISNHLPIWIQTKPNPTQIITMIILLGFYSKLLVISKSYGV